MTTTIQRVPGTSDAEQEQPWYRRFGCECWQTWTDWFQPSSVNWSNFTLIQIAGEAEWHMGNAEVTLGLLNLHLRLTYYWPHPERDRLRQMVKDIEAGTVETHPWPPAPTEEEGR